VDISEEEAGSGGMPLLGFLDDNPTIEGGLGFARVVGAIVKTVKNASRRPLTIGVFGGGELVRQA
jgi:hypothetical protein